MKKLALLLSVIIVLSLAGCSSESDVPGSSSTMSIEDEVAFRSIKTTPTPGSSCFSEIGYDVSAGTLLVTFRDSGASYVYDEVPKTVWNDFKNADSLGEYYNKNIKGLYDSFKLD